jgi:hypothetical protein
MTRDIVNRLRTNRDCLAPCLMDEAADEIVRLERVTLDLIAERDEARKMYCGFAEYNERGSESSSKEDIARALGWDCYKEDGK